MITGSRAFDIVIYGATGFVGKLVAGYLAQHAGNIRIALAGRSTERLRAARDALGKPARHWPLLIADATKPSTLESMAGETEVVVSTVGPYTRYGLPLVAACAAAGTHYADLAGETMFVRESIDEYHRQAVDTGARIVHSCGFDSVPSDLNAYALYRKVGDDETGELTDTNFVLRDASGGFSSGTVASAIEVLRAASSDPATHRLAHDPYTLSTDRDAEPALGGQPDLTWRRGRDIAPELGGIWTAGFAMAPHNTRIVRRSNALLDWAYGRQFRYSETVSVGSNRVAPVTSAVLTAASKTVFEFGGRLLRFVPRQLEQRLIPETNSGPDATRRERGYYRIETYTTTTTGARYVAAMSQHGDPGYQATSVLLGQCALALAFDGGKLPDRYGVLTPVAAMGDVLLERLPKAGVSLHTGRLG